MKRKKYKMETAADLERYEAELLLRSRKACGFDPKYLLHHYSHENTWLLNNGTYCKKKGGNRVK